MSSARPGVGGAGAEQSWRLPGKGEVVGTKQETRGPAVCVCSWEVGAFWEWTVSRGTGLCGKPSLCLLADKGGTGWRIRMWVTCSRSLPFAPESPLF